MDATLLKSLVALVPACLLLSGSVVIFRRTKTVSTVMQLVGAGCVVAVVLAHICEALHLFPGMRWGLEHSTGHYVDLTCALVALMFFPTGYLLHALSPK